MAADSLGRAPPHLDAHDVHTAGTAQPESFEIWIRTDPGVESVSCEYGTIAGSGASTGLNEGAENRDGSSGVNLSPLATSGAQLSVNTSPPGRAGR